MFSFCSPVCVCVACVVLFVQTLGCFLLENCFDLKLRCLNEKCGKDVMKHTLAYTHHHGRLVITVKKIRKKAHHTSLLIGSAVNGANAAATPRPLGLLGASPSHPSGRSSMSSAPTTPVDAASLSGAWNGGARAAAAGSGGRHPLDDPNEIVMWSRCKLCARRVTPYMQMSDPTYKLSFGKYLDLSFHQKTSVCRTGSCAHSLHQHHVRFFGYAGLMASFEYEPMPAYDLVSVPRLIPSRDALLLARYETDLRQLAVTAHTLFDVFIVRIAEIDGVLDLQQHRDQLRRLTNKVCAERDRFATYMQRIGMSVQQRPMPIAKRAAGGEPAPADSASSEATAAAAATTTTVPNTAAADGATAVLPAAGTATGPVPSTPLVSTPPSAPSTLLPFDAMDLYRLQRRVALNFLSWNNTLGDLSHLFFPRLPAQSTKESLASWWNTPKVPQAALPPARAQPAPATGGSSGSNGDSQVESRRESVNSTATATAAPPASLSTSSPLSDAADSLAPDHEHADDNPVSGPVLPVSASFEQVQPPLPTPAVPAAPLTTPPTDAVVGDAAVRASSNTAAAVTLGPRLSPSPSFSVTTPNVAPQPQSSPTSSSSSNSKTNDKKSEFCQLTRRATGDGGSRGR